MTLLLAITAIGCGFALVISFGLIFAATQYFNEAKKIAGLTKEEIKTLALAAEEGFIEEHLK